MFLSCRPFVALTTLSTPTRPVDNVVIATKGLQDRNTDIIAGTTVENKGKLILTLTDLIKRNPNLTVLSYCLSKVSCRDLVNRYGTLGSCKPQICYFFKHIFCLLYSVYRLEGVLVESMTHRDLQGTGYVIKLVII